MNAQKASELLKLAPHGLEEVICVDTFEEGSGFNTQGRVFDSNTHSPGNYPAEVKDLIPDDPEAAIYSWWEFDEEDRYDDEDCYDDDTLDDCKITVKYYPLDADGGYEEANLMAEYSAWKSEIWKRFEAGDGKPQEQTGYTRPTTAEYRTVGETKFAIEKTLGSDCYWQTWQERVGRIGYERSRIFDNADDAYADFRKRVAGAERNSGRRTRDDAR